jgi:glycosyltransferase involved in cell wall biosynthesis
MDLKISFITFTKNSGKKLKMLLDNVKDIVDEIIVIDGYSNDDTVEIAKSYGAKVFLRKPWGHVEPDRMFAISKASHDWILYLDDDEILGRKLKNEIKELLEKVSREGFVAIKTTRINYDVKCRHIIFGPCYPDGQIRIYRKDKVLYRGMVHEHPKVYGKIFELPEQYFIIHYIFPSKHKIMFYALLESIEYYNHFTSSKIKRILQKFLPFSASLMILSYLIKGIIIKKNPYINLCTIIRTIYPFSYYDILVHTLIKFRGQKRTQMSKIVSEHGLINLLEHKIS